jgi:hypothetical protein
MLENKTEKQSGGAESKQLGSKKKEIELQKPLINVQRESGI